MREIIYRGKRIDNGKWVYGGVYRVHTVETQFNPTETKKFNYWIIGEDGKTNLINKDTIGQFTGLCDKNGTKIWEHDILRGYRNNDSIVYWHEEQVGFDVKYLRNEPCSYVFDKHSAALCEIVGNKFDNPELLEVTK